MSQSYIGSEWCDPDGQAFDVIAPYSGTTLSTLSSATGQEVDRAVLTARSALSQWSKTKLTERHQVLLRYAELVKAHQIAIAASISKEVGKPEWEALTETKTMAGKIQLAIQAQQARCTEFGSGDSKTRFKPHGVMAVFGPFNFPCHLPNGHIIPALLAGNTVVFKPSENTPESSSWIVRLLLEAGLPEHVIQLVQGLKATGEALANHPQIDALAFTGSSRTGEFLARSFANNPGKMLALELGGNNPLVVWDVKDQKAAAINILQSAFITAGQRCTCARRLIVPRGSGIDDLLDTLAQRASRIRVGTPNDAPAPFCGPVISANAAHRLLEAQQKLVKKGGTILSELAQLKGNTGLLQPGVVDVTEVPDRDDVELFGPLLQVIRVDSFEAALSEANNTSYGLVSGLLSDDKDRYRMFYEQARAGLINWNYPLPGASGAAPFGGVGRSGNLRPSGFFAADYCAYPVASMETETLSFPETTLPGLWD